MKNIFILGVGRAGKSTLSRKIKENFPLYNLVHTDSIRAGIITNIEEKYVDYVMDYQTNEYLQHALLSFVDSQAKQDFNTYGVILEGAQILPAVLKRYNNLDNTIVVYLGHGNITKQDFFSMVREHDKPREWSYKKTDEELKPYIDEFYEKNVFLLEECPKYGFKYFDTSKNREKVLNEAYEYICKNMK